MRLQLSLQHSLLFAALEGRARGFAEGIEAAKQEIVNMLAAEKQQQETGKPQLVKEATHDTQ